MSEVGEVVGPGTPVAVLTEMDPVLVKAAVPDHLLAEIQPASRPKSSWITDRRFVSRERSHDSRPVPTRYRGPFMSKSGWPIPANA